MSRKLDPLMRELGVALAVIRRALAYAQADITATAEYAELTHARAACGRAAEIYAGRTGCDARFFERLLLDGDVQGLELIRAGLDVAMSIREALEPERELERVQAEALVRAMIRLGRDMCRVRNLVPAEIDPRLADVFSGEGGA
jgi:hypothetical protein